MRTLILLSFLLAIPSCAVRTPNPADLTVVVKSTVRPRVKVNANVAVKVQAPPVAVALEGAEVVEFFGVPLDGVEDVVFVLDRSGSMKEPALGRIAEIQVDNIPSPESRPPPGPHDAPPPDSTPPPGPYDSPPPDDPSSYGPDSAPPPGPDGRLPPDSAPPPGPDGAPPPESEEQPPPGPRKIDVAHAELIDALDRLPTGTRMNIVFFNGSLEAYAPGMVPLQDSEREGLVDFVRETTPTGSTALATAMRAAFLMNARRIILLSDGLGNRGGGVAAILRDAREAMRGGVRIDTIGIGKNQNAGLLQALAAESGGLYQPL